MRRPSPARTPDRRPALRTGIGRVRAIPLEVSRSNAATGWWLPPSRWSALRASVSPAAIPIRGCPRDILNHRPCVGCSGPAMIRPLSTDTGGRSSDRRKKMKASHRPIKDAPMLTWTGENRPRASATLARAQGGRLRHRDPDRGARASSEIPFGRGHARRESPEDSTATILRAPSRCVRERQWVLGATLGGNQSRPSPGSASAVRHQAEHSARSRSQSTSDESCDSWPLQLHRQRGDMPSMAGRLASRGARVRHPSRMTRPADLAANRRPGRVPNTMTLNFEGGGRRHSDFLFAVCARAPSRTTRIIFVRRWFAERSSISAIVSLEIEDRRQTSMRLCYRQSSAAHRAARVEARRSRPGFRISTIGGASYIHATASTRLSRAMRVVRPSLLCAS